MCPKSPPFLINNNRKWVEGKLAEDKDYFKKLAGTQLAHKSQTIFLSVVPSAYLWP